MFNILTNLKVDSARGVTKDLVTLQTTDNTVSRLQLQGGVSHEVELVKVELGLGCTASQFLVQYVLVIPGPGLVVDVQLLILT
ncbi:hypothetical protein DPMN_117952 [Dreissena polymorpha]|uniref:Uncharacterized protein n=1 Tax=Dreissena polymorpha TaxID=45954 RepID=A0A9D4GFL0_DREPO|nr:hypothetical protein DPMN_117952 [Dreissena polymorpha]